MNAEAFYPRVLAHNPSERSTRTRRGLTYVAHKLARASRQGLNPLDIGHGYRLAQWRKRAEVTPRRTQRD